MMQRKAEMVSSLSFSLLAARNSICGLGLDGMAIPARAGFRLFAPGALCSGITLRLIPQVEKPRLVLHPYHDLCLYSAYTLLFSALKTLYLPVSVLKRNNNGQIHH